MITVNDIGTRVRVVGRDDEWNACVGVLLGGPERYGARWPVRLEGTTGTHDCWFVPDELEPEADRTCICRLELDDPRFDRDCATPEHARIFGERLNQRKRELGSAC